MTATDWLSVGQTVVFLALCGFGWWLTGRQMRVEDNSELAVEHSLAAAQYANRAALDARAMLEEVRDESAILREWWHAHSGQPETQPMERVGTDTVESARVIDDGMDEFLAAARARWAEIAAAPAEKPTAKARRSQV